MTVFHEQNLRTNNCILVLTAILFMFCKNPAVAQNNAIKFNGSNDYISFGNDSNLNLKQFTVECWFKRTGLGLTTSTGNLGVIAYPLVTKGLAESDDNNRDLNYFLGIDSVTNVLTADIEEGELQTAPGLNHPTFGNTHISWNVWYHAAITFDANQMSVYLNGQLEMSIGWGVETQSQSIQQAGVASGITSYGLAKGFFQGQIDEVRIWNYTRTIDEIQANINNSFSSPQPGLVGNWTFNETAGDSVYDASGNQITGALFGTGFLRVSGAPLNMDVNVIPDYPSTLAPLNNDTCVAVNNAQLRVHANDTGGDTLVVKYYGRPAHNSPPPFTLVPMPDTQHYVSNMFNGNNEHLKSQTNWIATNRASKNITFVTELGDCVQNGSNINNEIEWMRADTAFSMLEDPVSTGLQEGIPYSVSVGNHDQSGNGNPNGSTIMFNQYFGAARFSGRSYYGGYYGNNFDNHYTLFTASGMDFIEVSLEFDTLANPLVVSWADSIVQLYSNRRAIVTSHNFLENDGTFGNQGQVVYNALKHNPNFFMMLCGHHHGENYRTEVYNGNTVYAILSDYQSRPYGGYAWMKLLEFVPAINKIFVKTYSPFLDKYETDWDSEYTLDYSMTPAFQFLGSTTVTSGIEASFVWSGLEMDSTYEWYAEVSDGKYKRVTELNRFKTNNNEQVYIGNDITQCGGQVSIGTADTNYTYLWSTNSTNSFITVNQTGNYTITATSIAGNCSVKDTVLVTINPIPESYLGPDTVACDHLNLGATIGVNYVYTWQNASNNPDFIAINSGTFSLYIQDSITGCFSSDTIDVIINPLPVVNLGSDITQCGGSVDIGVNTPGNTYLWSTGSTNAIITTSITGQYILTAISTIGGCINADTIIVTINPIPPLNLGVDTAQCGQYILSGTPGSNYLYTWNDGSNQQTLTTTASGTYSLILEDGLTGCNTSDTVNITIYPIPEINLGSNIVQCGGEVIIGNADPLNTYQWSTGSTNSLITVNQSGNYSVTATSNLGACIKSDSINVTINSLPVIDLVSDTSGCGSVNLNVDLGGFYQYNWQNGNNFPLQVVEQSGQYIVMVENILTGCVNSDTTDVEIYPLPIINLGNDTSCVQCDFNLSVQDGYPIYQWSNGSTNHSIHVSAPGIYVVFVTDINGCVARDTILVGTSSIIYPNPVTDYLVVNLPYSPTTATLKIVDDRGRLINFKFVKNETNYIIDCSKFAKGVYVLEVLNGENKQKFKILKQ